MLLFMGSFTGSPARLIYGSDYHGNTCGVELEKKMPNDGFNYKKHDLIVYPRLALDLLESYGVDISWSSIQLYGICVDQCPSPFSDGHVDFVCNYETERIIKEDMASAGVAYEDRRARANWIRYDFNAAVFMGLYSVGSTYSQGCWTIDVPFENLFYRCLPKHSQTTTTTEICTFPSDSAAYYNLKAKYVNSDVQFPSGGIESNPSFGKYFVPNKNCQTQLTVTTTSYVHPATENPLYEQFIHWNTVTQRLIGDLYTIGWFILLFGGILSLAVGFGITAFLRYCIECAVWTICLGVCVLSGAFTVFFAIKADYFQDLGLNDIAYVNKQVEYVESLDPLEASSKDINQAIYKVLFFIMLIVTVVLFLSLCCLKKYIEITIAVIREATKAMHDMPFIVVFPVFIFILQIFNIAYFMGSSAVILSASNLQEIEVPLVVEDGYDAPISFTDALAGNDDSLVNATIQNVTTGSNATGSNSTSITFFVEEDWVVYMFWYNVLGTLWIDQIIRAVGVCTISGAVCHRYWTRDKDDVGSYYVFHSLKRALKYSFGSLVMGAFIVAIVEFIRAIFLYFQRQTAGLKDKSNLVVKLILCIVGCCLWCLKQIAAYITRNAYIFIAMEGDGFCYSAHESIRCISKNFVQIATVEAVSHFVLGLVKISMTLICGLAFFVYMDQSESKYGTNGTEPLNFPLFPPLLTVIFAYTVSSSFVNVFELTIDSILLCYCKEMDMGRSPGAYFMSDELKLLLDKYRDPSKYNPYAELGSKSNIVAPDKINLRIK
jgi:hypothetical protein